MNNVTDISEIQMRTYLAVAHQERAKAFHSAFVSLKTAVASLVNAFIKHGETEATGKAANAH